MVAYRNIRKEESEQRKKKRKKRKKENRKKERENGVKEKNGMKKDKTVISYCVDLHGWLYPTILRQTGDN